MAVPEPTLVAVTVRSAVRAVGIGGHDRKLIRYRRAWGVQFASGSEGGFRNQSALPPPIQQCPALTKQLLPL
jgi:hypothetical protein